MKKKNILNYIVYGLLTINLLGCMDKTEQKTDFVYAESNKKIELIFENYESYLIIDKPTKARFITENINSQRLGIFGAGLAMNMTDNDGFRFVITPNKNDLKDGKLEIKISERLENGKTFTHKFLVPVKATGEKNY